MNRIEIEIFHHPLHEELMGNAPSGWYYWHADRGIAITEPVGPFETEEEAEGAAREEAEEVASW